LVYEGDNGGDVGGKEVGGVVCREDAVQLFFSFGMSRTMEMAYSPSQRLGRISSIPFADMEVEACDGGGLWISCGSI